MEDRLHDVLEQVGLQQGLDVEPVAMLRRDQNPLDLDGRWTPCSSTSYRTVTCDLPSGRRYGSTFALRTSASRFVSRCASRIGSGMSSSVSSRRVAEHHPLVARAERSTGRVAVLRLERLVDALGDVGRLLVDRDDDAAGLEVEAVLRARVADLGDRLAHDRADVDVGVRRDLAGDDDEPGRDERLAGDPSVRVVGEDGVEDRVRDLVGDLVRMALGDRLGREQDRTWNVRARMRVEP